ncbi:MAG: response regulator transcription factor [Caldilineaceae bacterium]
MTSLMLVEDHAVLAQTLTFFLARKSDLAVVATVTSAEAALEALPQTTVDLVLVDVSLPTIDGIELVAILQQRFPELPCLMLSGHDEPRYVRRALAAGARGYVMKNRPTTLIEAVPRVLAGEIYLSDDLRRKLGPG